VRIAPLRDHPRWIPTLARQQFDYWHRLTGFDTLADYVAALERWSAGDGIPTVLVATDGGALLGSVNLLPSEMEIRPALTPWLAQLFVLPEYRGGGVGAAMVAASIAHAGACGFSALYLYTSGTLPAYYARLGWRALERVDYLGRERTVMRYDIAGRGKVGDHSTTRSPR
jgi:GNAT superfamily N-acetyltransferase